MLALVVAAALAGSQPFEFKSLTSRSTEQSADAILGRCFNARSDPLRYCVVRDSAVAGQPAMIIAGFQPAGMPLLKAKLPARHYATVHQALVARYGPPCETRAAVARNALGASFPNAQSVWCFSDGRLILNQVDGKTTETGFTFVTDYYEKAMKERRPAIDF